MSDDLSKWKAMLCSPYGWEGYVRRHRSQVKRRIRKGVPACLRSHVWPLLSGSARLAAQSPNLYARLIQLRSKWESTIQRDISRTFPRHMLFRDLGGLGQKKLFRVLKAYSVFDPEVGYCQGMGFVTATFLLFLSEEDAFWMLVSILNNERFQMRGLYLPSMPLLATCFQLHDQLLSLCMPDLAEHLHKNTIHASLYASTWYLTLYSSHFPVEFVARVWDIFFAEGPKILFQVALALLKLGRQRFVQEKFDDLVPSLKTVQDAVEAGEMTRSALKIKLTKQHMQHLMDSPQG